MIPKTLSASSLRVASLCLDRWKAEYLHRGSGISNIAADIGTSVHAGLEEYVKAVYINKTHQPSLELIVSFYQIGYVKTFNTTDLNSDEYKDGESLVREWFKRTNLSSVKEVVSVETKKFFPIPYNDPSGNRQEIPFNYIIDRLDRIDDTTWEVVDYKTSRFPVNPEDLDSKIQARAYALAVQIEHPEATKIKVTFDMLRYHTVSTWFTKHDNIEFWKFLTNETQRIVDTKESDVLPTLNPECGFCVKKFTCKLMQRNMLAGGIHSLSIDEVAKLKSDIEYQMKANTYMVNALEEALLVHASNTDSLNWETSDGEYIVDINASKRRKFDARKAAEIMGPELFSSMGSMTITNLEKIINDPTLPEDMRNDLKGLLYLSTGDLKASVKAKKRIV